MTDDNADPGIVTCIYCNGLEDAAEMSDVEMEDGEHLVVDVAELPAGVAHCEVWETRIAHKCRQCMQADREIAQ